jgi:NADH dehydrogenase [ubiquinone] 1 alpha subcomplex assembly factor 5
MSEAGPTIIDREVLARRRARAAPHMAAHDFLVQRAADDIVDRLRLVRRQFPWALDVGAGRGVLAGLLRAEMGIGTVIEMEAVPGLLAKAEGLRVVADEELLPFGAGTLDLVASALSLQLVNDLPGALVQIRQALKPDGLLLASLLGGETLRELREAFVLAETETTGGASPRVLPFADVRTLGQLLQRAGFALPVADSDTVEVGYASALHLMRDLRGMGWSNALVDRRRVGLRRQTLARAVQIYAERFGRPDGRVHATFEIVTLTGWAPDPSQQQPLRPGSAKARLTDVLGVREPP